MHLDDPPLGLNWGCRQDFPASSASSPFPEQLLGAGEKDISRQKDFSSPLLLTGVLGGSILQQV